MLTPMQIMLVEDSVEQVMPMADLAAELFYSRLFAIDPFLASTLFKHTDMPEQRKVVMQALALAVKSLQRPGALIPLLQDFGRRHVRYGVRDEHYETFGAALLWALEQTLKSAFTPDLREAWAAVYRMVADIMKASARSVVAAESSAVA